MFVALQNLTSYNFVKNKRNFNLKKILKLKISTFESLLCFFLVSMSLDNFYIWKTTNRQNEKFSSHFVSLYP